MWLEDQNKSDWDEIISKYNGHIKQSYNWGELKQNAGWKCLRLKYSTKLQEKNKILQILYKKKFFFVFIYIAGNIINDDLNSNRDLLNFLKKKYRRKILYVRYHNEDELDPKYCEILKRLGWKKPNFHKGQNSITKKNLSCEQELMKSYKQKWRYNLKKSYESNFKISIERKISSEEIFNLSRKHENLKKAKKSYLHYDYQIYPLLKYFKNDLIIGKVLLNNQIIALRIFILYNNIAWNYMNINETKGIELNTGYRLLHDLTNEFLKMGVKKIFLGDLNNKQFPGKYQFNTGYEKNVTETNGEFIYSNSKLATYFIEIILSSYLDVKKNIFSNFIPNLKI
jgi:hypothetical protein